MFALRLRYGCEKVRIVEPRDDVAAMYDRPLAHAEVGEAPGDLRGHRGLGARNDVPFAVTLVAAPEAELARRWRPPS